MGKNITSKENVIYPALLPLLQSTNLMCIYCRYGTIHHIDFKTDASLELVKSNGTEEIAGGLNKNMK